MLKLISVWPTCPWPTGLKEPVPAHHRGLVAQPCVRRAAQPPGKVSYKYNASGLGLSRCQGVHLRSELLLAEADAEIGLACEGTLGALGCPQPAQL